MSAQNHERWMEELLAAPACSWPDLGLVPELSGVYAWWTTDEAPVCLKVGIATPRRRDGLLGRLADHFTSSYHTTTFARHLARDSKSPWAQGRDFTRREQRSAFLKEGCQYRYFVLKDLDESALRDFERVLERELHPVYLG